MFVSANADFVKDLAKDGFMHVAEAAPEGSSLSCCLSRETAQLIRVAAFGAMAEAVAKLEKRGSVYVEGQMTLNTWQSSSGEQRTGFERRR